MPLTQQQLHTGFESYLRDFFRERGFPQARIDVYRNPTEDRTTIRVMVPIGIGREVQQYAVQHVLDDRMLMQDIREGAAIVNRVAHEMARQLQRSIDAEAAARIQIAPEPNMPPGYSWDMNTNTYALEDSYDSALQRVSMAQLRDTAEQVLGKKPKTPPRKTLWQHLLEE